MPEQLCIPDTEAPEGQAHTGVWPPEPADEPEPYNRPRDLRAYARQALIDTYRRGRGPRHMRAAGELLSLHGDHARVRGRNQDAGAEVDRLLAQAGVPYAPQMEIGL